MKELWPTFLPVSKYAPTQNRVPAGNGQESGRFASGSGDSSAITFKHPGAIVLAAAGDPPPARDKKFEERELLGVATPEEELRHGRPFDPMAGLPRGVGIGPFAVRSIPAGPGSRPTKQQKIENNENGKENGCHTCGTKDPGTKSGNWGVDQQNPTALNPPGMKQVYFPHCMRCSRAQGGYVKAVKAKGLKDG